MLDSQILMVLLSLTSKILACLGHFYCHFTYVEDIVHTDQATSLNRTQEAVEAPEPRFRLFCTLRLFLEAKGHLFLQAKPVKTSENE